LRQTVAIPTNTNPAIIRAQPSAVTGAVYPVEALAFGIYHCGHSMYGRTSVQKAATPAIIAITINVRFEGFFIWGPIHLTVKVSLKGFSKAC